VESNRRMSECGRGFMVAEKLSDHGLGAPKEEMCCSKMTSVWSKRDLLINTVLGPSCPENKKSKSRSSRSDEIDVQWYLFLASLAILILGTGYKRQTFTSSRSGQHDSFTAVILMSFRPPLPCRPPAA
jgi:hypothetical protein